MKMDIVRRLMVFILAVCLISGCQNTGNQEQSEQTISPESAYNIYLSYYGVVMDLVERYGFHPDYWYVDDSGQDINYAGVTNAFLADMDMDGTDECICLYWPSNREMHIRIYTYIDKQIKLLLDKAILDMTDNMKGFGGIYTMEDGSSVCILIEQDETGYQTGTPHYSDLVYGKSGGNLTVREFSQIYSNGFNPGDPMPDWVVTTYWIDGHEVAQDHFEQKVDEFYGGLTSLIDYGECALSENVEMIGIKAGQDIEKIAQLVGLLKTPVS